MKIVKWIFSVLFGLWGLLNFIDIKLHILYLVTGLLSLGVAALLCPALESKLNFKYKGLIVAGLIVVSLIVYMIIGKAIA